MVPQPRDLERQRDRVIQMLQENYSHDHLDLAEYELLLDVAGTPEGRPGHE